MFFSFVDSNPKPHLLELDYRSTSSQRNQRGTVPACKMAFTLCFVTCWFCFAAGEFMLFYSTPKDLSKFAYDGNGIFPSYPVYTTHQALQSRLSHETTQLWNYCLLSFDCRGHQTFWTLQESDQGIWCTHRPQPSASSDHSLCQALWGQKTKSIPDEGATACPCEFLSNAHQNRGCFILCSTGFTHLWNVTSNAAVHVITCINILVLPKMIWMLPFSGRIHEAILLFLVSFCPFFHQNLIFSEWINFMTAHWGIGAGLHTNALGSRSRKRTGVTMWLGKFNKIKNHHAGARIFLHHEHHYFDSYASTEANTKSNLCNNTSES